MSVATIRRGLREDGAPRPRSFHLIDFSLHLGEPLELGVELAAGVGHRLAQALEFCAPHLRVAASRSGSLADVASHCEGCGDSSSAGIFFPAINAHSVAAAAVTHFAAVE
jgi:hypothetical protein